LAQEYGVSQMQIFGDSLLVIQWLRKEASIKNFTLQPLYDDIQRQMTTFSHISLSHIYRDKNRIVDLSKYGLGLEHGTWIISILQDGHSNELLMNLGYNDILYVLRQWTTFNFYFLNDVKKGLHIEEFDPSHCYLLGYNPMEWMRWPFLLS
jgi:hypothetical protein